MTNHGSADHGFVAFAKRAAATLLFPFFPADCRICGSRLVKVSRLPVCESCLIALRPLQGSYCSVCGEALHLASVDPGEALSRPKRLALRQAVLLRRPETDSQIGRTRHPRRERLRGAFVVGDPTRILKRGLLLVDDVVTTGTTASECARVLLRGGGARVRVPTVTRTLKIFNAVSLPESLSQGPWKEGSKDRLGMAARG